MQRFTLVKSFLVAGVASLVSVTSASAQTGFAWANNPSDSEYEPHAKYSANPFGSVTIVRRSTGTYTVIFRGLGGKGVDGGTVQVTSYGADRHYCQVVNWNSGAPDFTVNVSCFNPSNARPVDGRFTILAGWPAGTSRLAGRLQPVRSSEPTPLRGARSDLSLEGGREIRGPVATRIPPERARELFDRARLQGQPVLVLPQGEDQEPIAMSLDLVTKEDLEAIINELDSLQSQVAEILAAIQPDDGLPEPEGGEEP